MHTRRRTEAETKWHLAFQDNRGWAEGIRTIKRHHTEQLIQEKDTHTQQFRALRQLLLPVDGHVGDGKQIVEHNAVAG